MDRRLVAAGLRRALDDPQVFSTHVLRRPLHPYQVQVARAVLDSVQRRRGLTFSVMMARQCLDGDMVVLDRTGAAARLRHHPASWCTGVQPVLRLELKGGASLVGTANHPVRTRRGWVALGDLRLGEEVAVLHSWPRPDPPGGALIDVRLPWRLNAARTDAFPLRLVLDERHARLLGLLAAAGRLDQAFPAERPSQPIRLASRDPACLDEAEGLAEVLFPGLTPHRRLSQRGWRLFLVERGGPGARPLRQLLRACDLDLGFPRLVFRLPSALQEAFLEAALDPVLGGERLPNEPFARYLQTLLACLGRAARVERVRKGSGWRIRPGERLPPTDEAPGEDGERLHWREVQALRGGGQREVWDLAVPDKGWFLANGIAVHNSGKNELSAHLEALLLNRQQRAGGQIVKAAPTMNPQTVNSMRRLEGVLQNPLNQGRWRVEQGRLVRLGRAAALFFSADESAQVVGATADLLLEIDEAQDVGQEKYERDFRPMAAVANATTVLYGTAWSDDTLLAQQRRRNLELQAADGVQRHFEVAWGEAAAHNPAYGRFVQAEIERLGLEHPLIRTQYRLQDLEAESGLFSAQQCALLQGDHPRQHLPTSGRRYLAGIDLAGEDERAQDAALRALEPRRDSTVVTVAEVEWTTALDRVRQPRLRVVEHYEWTGTAHHALYDRLVGLLRDRWWCARVVVDATGVGAGVASFLQAALGPRVVEPFLFSAPTKSALGYELLAAVNAGRLTLYQDDGSAEWRRCWAQLRAARSELGMHQSMRFFVPDRLGHDDYLMSLALVAHAAASGEIRRASGRDGGGGGGRSQLPG